MQKKRPTLRDIAKRTTLSVSAVSLALRGDRSIPAKTRERVQAVASELGYAPDPMLSALTNYRTELTSHGYKATIAVVDNWPREGLTQWNLASRETFLGARERGAHLGYKVEPFWVPGFKTHKRASEILLKRGIQCLILEALPSGLGHLRLPWNKFCVVAYSFDFVSPKFSRLCSDEFNDLYLIRRKLALRGYLRPGLVMSERNNVASRNLCLAANLLWEYRHKAAGRKPVPPLILQGDDNGRRKLETWFRSHRPDVVIGFSDLIYHELLALGVEIPGEMAFVSRDLCDPAGRLTGMRPNREAIGAKAVDVLHSMFVRREFGPPANPETITLERSWHEGTTAPLQIR